MIVIPKRDSLSGVCCAFRFGLLTLVLEEEVSTNTVVVAASVVVVVFDPSTLVFVSPPVRRWPTLTVFFSGADGENLAND